MKNLEQVIESFIFNSRWLLAPFYIGMVLSIIMILVKFIQDFFLMIPNVLSMDDSEVVLAVLTLVDLSLVANLLLMVVFSGYENFVSKIDTAGHKDRPSWMGKVDFSGLKVKLIGSIVAISAIELLKAFVNASALTREELIWKVIIHVVLVASGLLFTLMDRIAERTYREKNTPQT